MTASNVFMTDGRAGYSALLPIVLLRHNFLFHSVNADKVRLFPRVRGEFFSLLSLSFASQRCAVVFTANVHNQQNFG